MKKKSILYLLIFGILSTNSCNLFQDDKNEGNNKDSSIIEQDINYNNQEQNFTAQDYVLPKELIYNNQKEGILIDKFYPIGWSKNGKFAYIVEPADEGSGYYLFEFVIFDLVNNKVSWSWKPKDMEEASLAQVWKDNYEKFKQELTQEEIVQKNKYELKTGITSYKSNQYQISLETTTKTDPDFGLELIKGIKIKLISKELGSKIAYNQTINDNSMILGAYVPGYLISPFDGRIAIICKYERTGYEGPPNVVYFDIVGSDLVRGFKKESGS